MGGDEGVILRRCSWLRSGKSSRSSMFRSFDDLYMPNVGLSKTTVGEKRGRVEDDMLPGDRDGLGSLSSHVRYSVPLFRSCWFAPGFLHEIHPSGTLALSWWLLDPRGLGVPLYGMGGGRVGAS